MLNKYCTQCNTTKPRSDFYTSKTTYDGLNFPCKECKAINSKKQRLSYDGIQINIYKRQLTKSKERGHIPPSYTYDEFIIWLNNNNYDEMYSQYKACGFILSMRPSVDRLNSNKAYSFGNIQLVTWGENKANAIIERKKGTLKTVEKAIEKLTMDGTYIETYHTTLLASKHNNIHPTTITKALSDTNRFSAAGFRWRYVI